MLNTTGSDRAIRRFFYVKFLFHTDLCNLAEKILFTQHQWRCITIAKDMFVNENIRARVVSMPSWNLFDKQPAEYREKVLPKNIRKRLAVEAGSPVGWMKYTTDNGDVIGIEKFGESAPADELFVEYGFTVENVVKKARDLLQKN